MLWFGVPRRSITYSFFSSGEKASPLGLTKSVMTALNFPSAAMRNTLVFACSRAARQRLKFAAPRRIVV